MTVLMQTFRCCHCGDQAVVLQAEDTGAAACVERKWHAYCAAHSPQPEVLAALIAAAAKVPTCSGRIKGR